MQTAQPGDRVQVHYVKRLQDGSVASSHDRGPLEVTVGVDHPRLPGLGLALVGLAPGTSTRVRVPAERAYGPSDPAGFGAGRAAGFPKTSSWRSASGCRFRIARVSAAWFASWKCATRSLSSI